MKRARFIKRILKMFTNCTGVYSRRMHRAIVVGEISVSVHSFFVHQRIKCDWQLFTLASTHVLGYYSGLACTVIVTFAMDMLIFGLYDAGRYPRWHKQGSPAGSKRTDYSYPATGEPLQNADQGPR